MLRILNSQTRELAPFEPLDSEGRKVGMYTCGPTVYDSLHLGHARAAVMPDVVRANTNATVIMIAERVADFISEGK